MHERKRVILKKVKQKQRNRIRMRLRELEKLANADTLKDGDVVHEQPPENDASWLIW